MAFPYQHFLVVGATSGIGRALADKFVATGAKVTAVGRRKDRLDEWVQKHNGKNVNSIAFDISEHDKIPQFAADVMKEHPDIDSVVLNAGVQHFYDLLNTKTDLSPLHQEMKVNYLSNVELTHAFLPYLQKQSSPTSFIVTSSNLATIPAALLPGYSASKAAMNAYTLCLRFQLKDSNVKVIELSPPMVQTELHDYVGPEIGRNLGMPLDAFTEEAYKGLASGKDTVIVGPPGDEQAFHSIIDNKRTLFEGLAKMSAQRAAFSKK